jgi:hypothetical protein
MANEYLTRTPTSSGNEKVWTLSAWIKTNDTSNTNYLFGYFDEGASPIPRGSIQFNESNVDGKTTVGWNPTGSSWYQTQTEGLHRDSGNWLHLCIAVDTTKTDEGDGIRMYFNGAKESATSYLGTWGSGAAALNVNTGFNRFDIEHYINAFSLSSGRGKVQYSDFFWVDGQALGPDVFGFYKDGDGYVSAGSTMSTDFRPGQWMPHSPSKIKKDINRKGGFGANGFYLPMNDNSNPGADFHCDPNSIITLKGEDLPQPRNGAPTTSDAYVSEVRKEIGGLGFAGCVKFDGTDDYLTVPSSDDFNFGTGDFTIEAFCYRLGGFFSIFDHQMGLGNFTIFSYVNGPIQVYNNQFLSSGVNPGNRKWFHLAVVRQSGTLSFYIDGFKASTTHTFTHNFTTAGVNIGMTNYGERSRGFVSNLRVIKGTALYTSDFTPPTSPLTNVTNTKLLCCQSSTSATAAAVIPTGSISAVGGAHATTSELTGSIVLAVPGISGGLSNGYGDYSASIKGDGSNRTGTASGNIALNTIMHSHYGSGIRVSGSGNSNATGGLLEFASNTDFNLGSGDFTFEGWLYSHTSIQDSGVFGIGSGGVEPFLSWTNGVLKYRHNQTVALTAPFTVATEQWHHVVLQRYFGQLSLIINGVVAAAGPDGGEVYDQSALLIGSWASSRTYGFDGDIQDVRLYKGIAKYTQSGGFDVPKPWAPRGIEEFRTTADTCKNNFATLNGLDFNSSTTALSDGNLTMNATSNNGRVRSATYNVPNSGKYYFEFYEQVLSISSTNYIAIQSIKDTSITQQYRGYGYIYTDSVQATGYDSIDQGDLIGVGIDADNGTVSFYNNGTLVATVTSSTVDHVRGATLVSYLPRGAGSYPPGDTRVFNFGQNPTFSGQVTAGTNADASGKGLFKYAVPSGYSALCEDNLPTPAIADPGDHFKCVLYTGDNSAGRRISDVGFQPDLVWIKARNATPSHVLTDSVRGIGHQLSSDDSGVEVDSGTLYLTGFANNGFDLNDGANSGGNTTGRDYVAWCWKAGGPAVTNGDGSRNTQVSVNRTAGFSIGTFTGDVANTHTIGHGLGKVPSMIIVKERTGNSGWGVYHKDRGNTKVSYLNAPDSEYTESGDTASWNTTDPTSSVFSVGKNGATNDNTLVFYAWAEIEGFSKFGSYVGNANTSQDGPFVYCGFKPAWIMMKNVDASGSWVIMDNSRCSTNPNNNHLLANSSNKQSVSNMRVDFVSNGFKITNLTTNYTDINGSGNDIIFAAFAESPFQTANAK